MKNNIFDKKKEDLYKVKKTASRAVFLLDMLCVGLLVEVAFCNHVKGDLNSVEGCAFLDLVANGPE